MPHASHGAAIATARPEARRIGPLAEIRSLVGTHIRDYGMYIALVAIIVIFSLQTGGMFISSRNISNLINQTGYIAVLAVGMTLILIIRHIDLSVGYVAGFMGAVAAILMTQSGVSAGTAIGAVLVFGLILGMFYGFLVATVGVPAFVVTLAGMLVFRGLLLQITEGTGTIVIPNQAFIAIGNGFIPDIAEIDGVHLLTLVIGAMSILLIVLSQLSSRRQMLKYEFAVMSFPIFVLKLAFISAIIGYLVWTLARYNGISWTVIIVALVVAIYSFIMNRTTVGRHIYGVGGNPEAAELSGVNIRNITVMVFASMSMLAALAGILFASRLQSATTTAGTGFEMDAIAAAYVGGVSASGGVGKVTGSIVGAFVMASLTNGMNLMGVGISYQYAIRGAILVLAVIFDISTRQTNR